MFKNVGGKIRVVALVFFILMCVASFLILVLGIINGAIRGWASPIIGGVVVAAVGFVFSLISTYMLYGYGTLIKSCEDNARINAEILALLRNGRLITIQGGQPIQTAKPVQNVKPVQPVKAEPVAAPVVEAPAVEETVTEAPVVEESAVEAPVDEAPAEAPFAEELVEGQPRQEELVKRCPSCGSTVRSQANFCNLCGYKMK